MTGTATAIVVFKRDNIKKGISKVYLDNKSEFTELVCFMERLDKEVQLFSRRKKLTKQVRNKLAEQVGYVGYDLLQVAMLNSSINSEIRQKYLQGVDVSDKLIPHTIPDSVDTLASFFEKVGYNSKFVKMNGMNLRDYLSKELEKLAVVDN